MPVRNLLWLKSRRHPGGKTRPVRFGVGQGLYLQITPANTRSWLFRYTLNGIGREMGLGPFDSDGSSGVSLAAARRLADAARQGLQAGTDPIAAREKTTRERQTAEIQSRQHSLRLAAEGYISVHRDGWRSAKHAAQWLATLEQHVFPQLGDKDVAAISIGDIRAVLEPIWQKIPETASRVRQRLEAVMGYAAAPSRQWRSGENPARWRGVLDQELPATAKIIKRRPQPSLPWPQIPHFWLALSNHDGVSATVVRFAILTASRSTEAREAIWSEFDLKAAIWLIPAIRMKMKKLHRVPLSPPAIEILHEMRGLSAARPDGLVFLSNRLDRPLSDMSLSMLVRGMSHDRLPEGEPPRWRDIDGRAAVVHGFRSSLKEWSLEHGYPDHLSEKALAHSDKDKVRAAYARSDLLEQRKPMMDAWGSFCTGSAKKKDSENGAAIKF